MDFDDAMAGNGPADKALAVPDDEPGAGPV